MSFTSYYLSRIDQKLLKQALREHRQDVYSLSEALNIPMSMSKILHETFGNLSEEQLNEIDWKKWREKAMTGVALASIAFTGAGNIASQMGAFPKPIKPDFSTAAPLTQRVGQETPYRVSGENLYEKGKMKERQTEYGKETVEAIMVTARDVFKSGDVQDFTVSEYAQVGQESDAVGIIVSFSTTINATSKEEAKQLAKQFLLSRFESIANKAGLKLDKSTLDLDHNLFINEIKSARRPFKVKVKNLKVLFK